jgi:hypothetical protein
MNLHHAVCAAVVLVCMSAASVSAESVVHQDRPAATADHITNLPRHFSLLDASRAGRFDRLCGVDGACTKAACRTASRSRIVQTPQRKRNWIKRHPVLFGTLVGFVGGYLIGYLPGDDGVFYDFTAEFNGMVMGGIGAGTGAAVGAIASAVSR